MMTPPRRLRMPGRTAPAMCMDRQRKLGEPATDVRCRDIDGNNSGRTSAAVRAHQYVDAGQDLIGLGGDDGGGVGIYGVAGDKVHGCT